VYTHLFTSFIWSGNHKFYIQFLRLLGLQSFIITLYVLYLKTHFKFGQIFAIHRGRKYKDMGVISILLTSSPKVIYTELFYDKDTSNFFLQTYFRITLYTGCLMKNASTHNFVIYYPISMNKKIKDMVFQALQNSHKLFFFWRYLQYLTIVNFFFLMDTCSFLGLVW
jgi:hypothetical protein